MGVQYGARPACAGGDQVQRGFSGRAAGSPGHGSGGVYAHELLGREGLLV
jgi:hypothetical protein